MTLAGNALAGSVTDALRFVARPALRRLRRVAAPMLRRPDLLDATTSPTHATPSTCSTWAAWIDAFAAPARRYRGVHGAQVKLSAAEVVVVSAGLTPAVVLVAPRPLDELQVCTVHRWS